MDLRHPLDGVNAKIGRAKEHLGDLKRAFEEIGPGKRYGILVHHDPEARKYVVYAYVPYKVRLSLGLLVGDVVHNLRSALDHLACQLVIANGKPSRRNSFPIYLPHTEDREEKVASSLNGAHEDVITRVQGLQPEDADDPLWILNRLDNDDKHNLVHIAVVVADLGPMGVGAAGDQRIDLWNITTDRVELDTIEDGADFYSMVMNPSTPEMKVQTSPEVKIAFAEAGPGRGQEVFPLLASLTNHVENVIVPLFGLGDVKPARRHWRPPPSRAILGG